MLAKALTIAGSDSGGGAGIQADLKTFQELNVFGMSAITAITAQNSQGVQGVYPVAAEGVAEQITSVMDDIGADAVKTGMLFDKERIDIVSAKVKQYNLPHLVVDPVMVSTSGAKLLQDEAIDALITQLIPLASVLTPNLPEAEVITGMKLDTFDKRKKAAREIFKMGAHSVLVKGGHEKDGEHIRDIFFDGNDFHYFSVPKVDTKHTHGTGCTYAAAITAQLAKGLELKEAVYEAKKFIHIAIMHGFSVGEGPGPVNHAAHRFYPEPLNDMEVDSE